MKPIQATASVLFWAALCCGGIAVWLTTRFIQLIFKGDGLGATIYEHYAAIPFCVGCLALVVVPGVFVFLRTRVRRDLITLIVSASSLVLVIADVAIVHSPWILWQPGHM